MLILDSADAEMRVDCGTLWNVSLVSIPKSSA